MRCNQYKQMHYWVTHNLPLFSDKNRTPFGAKQKIWDTSLSYEIDNKSQKYLSRERSLVYRATPIANDGSPLPVTFKAESTFRKNVVDQYASKKYIINDSLASIKTSVGMEASVMDPMSNVFSNIDAELAINSPRFLKLSLTKGQMINLV